jgi:recombination protein RecA
MAKMQLGALVSASQAWLQRSQMTLSSVHEKKWTAAALGGCLAELSGSSAAPVLTVAFRLVHQVQQQGEPVAWISSNENTFFPPDVADGGVDLSALPVIRLATLQQRLTAIEQLVCSGAFGLLVADLEECVDLPLAVQTRLAEQALAQSTLVLCLTVKTDQQPSLGSLVTVRAQARRIRHGDGRFICQVHALKDKRSGPDWVDEEWCCGPTGVR